LTGGLPDGNVERSFVRGRLCTGTAAVLFVSFFILLDESGREPDVELPEVYQ
jgi:hypothetical protein